MDVMSIDYAIVAAFVLIAAAFDPAFQVVIMLIGLSGLVLYPGIEAKQVLPHNSPLGRR